MNKKVVTKGTFQRQMTELRKKIKSTIQVDILLLKYFWYIIDIIFEKIFILP